MFDIIDVDTCSSCQLDTFLGITFEAHVHKTAAAGDKYPRCQEALQVFFYLFLQVQVVTTGWVSLALTFRGSLISSDIILGWIAPTGAATLIVSLLLYLRKNL